MWGEGEGCGTEGVCGVEGKVEGEEVRRPLSRELSHRWLSSFVSISWSLLHSFVLSKLLHIRRNDLNCNCFAKS